MRYVQPYGMSDTDASYANGNPATGMTGFIPAAESVEHKLRELDRCIRLSRLLPSRFDLEQLTRAVRSQSLNFAVDVGTANALLVGYLPKFRELSTGLPLRVLVAFDNTGPATITVDGIGPIFILRANGSNLVEGDLRSGEVADLVYDGSYFQLTNFLGYSAEQETNNYYTFGIPYAVDTSGTVNLITAPFNPVITTLTAGLTIEVKIANTNTAPASIIVNSLPSQIIMAPSGSTRTLQELEAGQLAVGMVALLVYDGLQFQLINPAKPKSSIVIEAPPQVVKLATYEDQNKHIVSIWPFFPYTTSQVTGWPSGVAFAAEQPVYEFSYTPVSVGNKVRIEASGSISYRQPKVDPAPCVLVYLSYAYGNENFNPPAWPGLDYPTMGTFGANVGVLNFERFKIVPYLNALTWAEDNPNIQGEWVTATQLQSGNVYTYFNSRVQNEPQSLDINFRLLGQLTVPQGALSAIKFRLSITAFPSYQREWTNDVPTASEGLGSDHIVHGGTIYQITELTK